MQGLRLVENLARYSDTHLQFGPLESGRPSSNIEHVESQIGLCVTLL